MYFLRYSSSPRLQGRGPPSKTMMTLTPWLWILAILLRQSLTYLNRLGPPKISYRPLGPLMILCNLRHFILTRHRCLQLQSCPYNRSSSFPWGNLSDTV